ncbi:serine hydrolase domain-containing protein [Dyadobacter frigoris]|uniref:Beta-lactamase family protein n=1 Tax=Dyadobacter frigoris TaxID=2576211 RepID=A0A4U6CTL7_9BACT|nr:serine hydrolase domain-containing protein [Dyadobacter frigoris]TKT87576.1 beta-lactamase family protein [Dyadobacter frigoris]
MKKIFLSAILALYLFTSGKLYAQRDVLAGRLDSLMRAAQRTGVFNGNVLVVKKGQLIYKAAIGYADGSKNYPLTPDKRFDIGSIAKEFNGIAIMLLAQQGKLSLTDRLQKYFPELPAWADSVEISHLLNYTSGLPVSSGNSDEGIKKELMALKHLTNVPGRSYVYSYSNVYLQQRIIEKVSGMQYNSFIEKHILKPCGMTHTLMDLPISDTTMAIAFNNKFVNEKPRQTPTGWPRLTIDDLYRFLSAADSYKLISKSSMQQLAQSFGEGESSLGNAKFENGELTWHQHHGSNYNYEALMTHDLKQDLYVILMTNNQNFKVRPLTEAIIAVLNQKPYTVPKRSLYLELREEVLADFNNGIAFYRLVREQKKDQYDFSFEIGDLVNTGKFLMRRNRPDDAVKLFQLGLLLDLQDKDYAIACQFIAEAYSQQGNRDLAILYAQKAARKDPDNKIVQSFLEQALK